jgi:hypothetical protein
LFRVYVKHRDAIERVTFWGVADGDSWLNNWPMKGRTNYPLLFDRLGRAKPAVAAIISTTAASNLKWPVELTAEQDHRRFLDLFHLTALRPGVNGNDLKAPNAVNYDEAKANP